MLFLYFLPGSEVDGPRVPKGFGLIRSLGNIVLSILTVVLLYITSVCSKRKWPTCKRSILGIDLMRVANSSLLSYGPKSENNLSCLAICSGKDRSLIEYLHRDTMRGNISYDILVSDRLMYLMLGHLTVRASTCSFFTCSLARFIAVRVGVTKWQICVMESCDKSAPHNTRSVSFMHLVTKSAIVFDRTGLYISASADGCLWLGVVFITDKLMDVMLFVLSNLSRMRPKKVKSASDKSKVARFFERIISVAAMLLLPPNSWRPK